jgi:hypothetical protein
LESISDASQATIIMSPKEANAPSSHNPAVAADKQTLEEITKATIGLKAVKADDAEVPVYLRDREVIGDNPSDIKCRAMNGFCQFGLRWFRRALTRDCLHRLRTKFGRAWELMAFRTQAHSSGQRKGSNAEYALARFSFKLV